MADMSSIFAAIVRIVSQVLMIFGGVVPYIPQYLIIKRSQNAEGFSNYVCLTLLIANILRIEFWFGKHFEIPLLVQSIMMIICMIIMLEICIRVHSKSIRHHLPVNQQKELPGDTHEKKNLKIFKWIIFGDGQRNIFKTVYFIIRNAPKQFWLCGILQISIDIAILCQVIFYSDKYRLRKR